MRTMQEAAADALQDTNVPYMVLVELDFAEGFVRLTNAGYDFIWNGYTWTGAGNLGSISNIEEGQELQMYGCTLTLTGIASDYVAKCFGVGYSGRAATIYLAPLDSNYTILSDPVVIFKGRMDTMPISLGNESVLQITIESKLVDWERPRVRRYNNEDQQAEFPGDLGFEFVPQMVEKSLLWGRAED